MNAQFVHPVDMLRNPKTWLHCEVFRSIAVTTRSCPRYSSRVVAAVHAVEKGEGIVERARQGVQGDSTPRLLSQMREKTNAPTVIISRKKSRLFKEEGNPMIYTGAVETINGNPAAGDPVVVANGDVRLPFAWGVFNPHSLYKVRVMQVESDMAAHPQLVLDLPSLVQQRIQQAVELRRALGLPSSETNVFRLVNSEGDRLSGLVVDVFDDVVVVVSTAFWVERYRDVVIQALRQLLGSVRISWRSSTEMLKLEGWQADSAMQAMAAAAGPGLNEVEEEELVVREEGVRYVVPLRAGQKTGFYADQRENRQYLRHISAGKRVLDLCCYSGAFAVSAGKGGATHVTGVDSSAVAVELAARNAHLNGLDTQCSFVKADVVRFMQEALEAGEKWDLVVLDPPKLAPNRKTLPRATHHYRKLNSLAMQVLKPGGLLMTCSCSGAMTQSGNFISVVQGAAECVGLRATVLRDAGAGADHPLDPCYPEGWYLSNILVRVT